MAKQLTAADARESLSAHVAAKGAEIGQKFGPRLDWAALQRLLQDTAYVRYPCEIRFDVAGLHPGEFAHPEPRGERPEDGFVMYVHPLFALDLASVPALVLYQLVAVNYGEFASADDAEIFGANALGLSQDAYYELLCAYSDRVGGGAEESLSTGCNCGSAGCAE